MIGTHYSDSHVTTGFANHLARPLFRERQSDDMSEAAAVELMHDALRVCYYRDKQSMNKFTLAKVWGHAHAPTISHTHTHTLTHTHTHTHAHTCACGVRAQVTKDGVTISEPFALDVKWDFKAFTEPTKWAVGTW
jgi:20S proteasome subunit beta 7